MFLKMHVYVYKVSYCNKSGVRDSRKFLRRYNHLESITLIEKVLVGRCPGIICVGGQLSQEKIVRVQLSGGNFSKWELYGRQLPGAQLSKVGIFQRGIARGTIVLGGNCPRGNWPGGTCQGDNCPGGIVLLHFLYLFQNEQFCFFRLILPKKCISSSQQDK